MKARWSSVRAMAVVDDYRPRRGPSRIDDLVVPEEIWIHKARIGTRVRQIYAQAGEDEFRAVIFTTRVRIAYHHVSPYV